MFSLKMEQKAFQFFSTKNLIFNPCLCHTNPLRLSSIPKISSSKMARLCKKCHSSEQTLREGTLFPEYCEGCLYSSTLMYLLDKEDINTQENRDKNYCRDCVIVDKKLTVLVGGPKAEYCRPHGKERDRESTRRSRRKKREESASESPRGHMLGIGYN